jgi:hypothetical protein
MENEENSGKDQSSGQSIEELRLIFGRLPHRPLGRMERLGRFIGLVAGKIAARKSRPEKRAEKDVA